MGKRKIDRKQVEPQTTSTPLEREMESPPPPPPQAAQPGAMIPAAALEMFLRATNPNVDWSATIAALGQIAGQTLTNPLDISPISVYKAPEMRTEIGDEEGVDEGRMAETKEGANDDGEQAKGDRKEEAKNGATQEEKVAREGEATGERKMNEMARKQGLLIDEEFEALLKGAQRIGHETTATD